MATKQPRTNQLRTFWPATSLAQDVKAASFELVGTTVFLLLAFGGVQASNDVVGSVLERTLYIATSFGLSLLVSAWFFFRATGGLFNPDVSLALLLAGCIGPVRFALYCIAQLTGAIAAAGIVIALTPGPLSFEYVPRAPRYSIVSNNSHSPEPAPNINLAQGVFIEMFITAALCLAVLMLGAEKHSSTPFAPVRVLLSLFFFAPGRNSPFLTCHLPPYNLDRRGPDAICLPSVSVGRPV
jgi:aquaporin related protein